MRNNHMHNHKLEDFKQQNLEEDAVNPGKRIRVCVAQILEPRGEKIMSTTPNQTL